MSNGKWRQIPGIFFVSVLTRKKGLGFWKSSEDTKGKTS